MDINIATVLLEKNRWGSKLPSFTVSDWVESFKCSGFSGIELWENHFLKASSDEKNLLTASELPINILNSYCGFEDEDWQSRETSASLAYILRPRGIKFNFGSDYSNVQEYKRNFEIWLDQLPEDCRPLCECHRGTILEYPGVAKEILQPYMDRVGIILHPFSLDSNEELEHWFHVFYEQIEHMHVVSALNVYGSFDSLRTIDEMVQERVRIIKDYDYKGSWTIEFTEGIGLEEEDIERLWMSAVGDYRYLKDILSLEDECIVEKQQVALQR